MYTRASSNEHFLWKTHSTKNSNTKWSVYKGSSAHRFFEPCWDFGIHMEIIQLKMDLLETRKTENLLLLLLLLIYYY